MIWIAGGLIMLGAVVLLGRMSGPNPKPTGHVWRAVMAGLFAVAAAAAVAAGRWALVIPFLGVAGGFTLAFYRALKRAEALAEGEAAAASTAPHGADMTERDALEILGLAPGASRQEILAAYRRIMARAHPDAGGSDRLAMMVDRAKRRLIDDD